MIDKHSVGRYEGIGISREISGDTLVGAYVVAHGTGKPTGVE